MNPNSVLSSRSALGVVSRGLGFTTAFSTLLRSVFLFVFLLPCRPAFSGEIHEAAQRGEVEEAKALLKTTPELITSKDVSA